MPEIILSIFSMFIIMVGVFSKQKAMSSFLLWLTCFVLVLTAIWVLIGVPDDSYAFNGAFRADGFSILFKVCILLSAAIVLAMSKDYLERTNLLNYEYSALICLSIVGMMIMVASTNLMSVYLGLELQSLSLYVIAAFRRDSLKSTEAGLKYFVLGALSSGLFLYGASLVYGFSGTTNFLGIAKVVELEGMSTGILFGLIFLLVGMAFKISAVPFHMWTPDVYEGSPTPVTAFFFNSSKACSYCDVSQITFWCFWGRFF
jgi:NADH-quinone oxidoreductase subunit N